MLEVGSKQVHRVPRALSVDSTFEKVEPREGSSVPAWKQALLAELKQSTVRERLARGLVGVGFIHLACFLVCQSLYDPSVLTDLRHPLVWLTELGAVLFYLRQSLGKDWIRSSSALNLAAKFWTTFLILSFNLVTLNAITGFELAWYKPVWATLSTFLFASLAWLFSPWFFVLAVQMWTTGLLMVRFLHWAYLIYGVSWFIGLSAVAYWIRPVGRRVGEESTIQDD